MAREKYEIELHLTSSDGITFHGGASFWKSDGEETGTGSTTGISGGEYKTLADITRALKNIIPNIMLPKKKITKKKK